MRIPRTHFACLAPLIGSLALGLALLGGGVATAAIGTPVAIMAEALGTTSGSSSPTNVDAPVGSLLVFAVSLWNIANGTITGCTLSDGDTLTLAAQPAATGSVYNMALLYASNTAHDLPSGGSITCTTSNGSGYAAGGWSVSGANGGVDKTNSSVSGSAASVSLATGTLAVPSEIVFGAERYVGGTYTEGSGFSTLYSSGGNFIVSYEITAATTSQTWGPSWTSATAAAAALATFEASAATGCGSPGHPHTLMLTGAGCA